MKNKINNEVTSIESVIDEWIQKLVHNTVFQTDTAMYNKLHDSIKELKQKLVAPSKSGITTQTEKISEPNDKTGE